MKAATYEIHARARGPVEVAEQFRPGPETPRAARHLVADVLSRYGHQHSALGDDAQLLMSELVTNAVLHAESPVSVVVRCDAAGLRLSVHDLDPSRPTLTERGARTGLGMGLRLIESLSRDWGVEPTADGKTVWAALACAQ